VYKRQDKYIALTIESVINQTIRPERWIIVDDGSTDDTPNIVKKYAAENDFIELQLRKSVCNARDVGYGGIRAFNHGARSIDFNNFDFIVNLDADVSFDPDYFEKLFKKFEEMPDLGIAGGKGWNYRFDKLVPEKIPVTHVPGYTKVYRRECYADIFPVRELPSWDTIDELQAQYKGWKTLNFDDISIIHHKPMSLSADSFVKGKFVQGRISHSIGYPLDFMLPRTVKVMLEVPYIVGGLSLLAGFMTGLVARDEIIIEKELVRFLRSNLRSRILGLFKRHGD
jgi:glycosyltransferase involved in cell wall biosynthesis